MRALRTADDDDEIARRSKMLWRLFEAAFMSANQGTIFTRCVLTPGITAATIDDQPLHPTSIEVPVV
jgi:hypothetical protein